MDCSSKSRDPQEPVVGSSLGADGGVEAAVSYRTTVPLIGIYRLDRDPHADRRDDGSRAGSGRHPVATGTS